MSGGAGCGFSWLPLLGFDAVQDVVLVRQFSPFVSILGLVFFPSD